MSTGALHRLGFVAVVALSTGCYRTVVPEYGDAGDTPDVRDVSTPEAGARQCAPNCTIGHQCCVGGCGGAAAVTSSDCCVCLPGEVSSAMCPRRRCGR